MRTRFALLILAAFLPACAASRRVPSGGGGGAGATSYWKCSPTVSLEMIQFNMLKIVENDHYRNDRPYAIKFGKDDATGMDGDVYEPQIDPYNPSGRVIGKIRWTRRTSTATYSLRLELGSEAPLVCPMED